MMYVKFGIATWYLLKLPVSNSKLKLSIYWHSERLLHLLGRAAYRKKNLKY